VIRRVVTILLAVALLAGGAAWYIQLRRPVPERWLGYADADYVRVAPTQLGRLVSLGVARGDLVTIGAPLFQQDDIDDRAARDQAAATLAEAQEKLADLQAPGRADEITEAQADVNDTSAAYERAARDLARGEQLVVTGATSRQTVDQMRADARSAEAKLRAAQARLALARDTNGRAHAITAQTAAVAAARAALESAQWRLDQRHVTAPASGRVADTFARPGETIAAGTPVVSILPPDNIFVRFYVPEAALARIHADDQVGIICDSCPRDLRGRISFIATQPEYTPPVIYSEGTRGSLVYLIEARPDAAPGATLKPGQPLDVIPPDMLAAR
jgi:HlyD family secretion protein